MYLLVGAGPCGQVADTAGHGDGSILQGLGCWLFWAPEFHLQWMLLLKSFIQALVLQMSFTEFYTSSNQRLGVRSLPVIIVVCYWNHYCERLKFYRHNIYWQSPLLFCGFWHDLWWHLAWRLQFWVNSQIPCYENVSFSLLLVMFKYKG